MDTSKVKKFAQFARRSLIGQVGAKLESVLAEGAAARREHPEAMKKLETAIAQNGKGQVVERVAHIWFNRFSALRYMDVNDLNPVRVVSPLVGQFQPEILADAKAGNIDDDRVPENVRDQIRALLDGRAPSQDPQAEAYRLLLVAICNDWHRAMPFLFERIDDFTELLLPEDLLSNSSILAYMREAMTPDACQDVEIIGWLYQFYISEKKDEVFVGLKKNKKITRENIPAATQLFTPHWIVRYLVENSLGRLWMLNRPNSRLKERMDYYIAPEEPEEDFLALVSPEEIRVCDPACGSGHMLTYAFDLLHAIYEEEGYDAAEIPGLILTHNLYGIEIDERAGALAAFALTMKAAARRKRFLRRAVQPNVCVLEPIKFEAGELSDYMDTIGRDLFTAPLRQTLAQFEEADNFGSLIRPALTNVAGVRQIIESKDVGSNLFLRDVQARVQNVLRMADYLAPKYHVVVANPPYMGGKGMNPRLGDFAKATYPDSKSDLYAMFIERGILLTVEFGYASMVSMHAWMFLSSFEKLRRYIFGDATVVSMAHLGARAFDSIGGEVVATTAFTLKNTSSKMKGVYLRLIGGQNEKEKAMMAVEATRNVKSTLRHVVSPDSFSKIPGTPVAYWISDAALKSFDAQSLVDVAPSKQGMATSNNDRFLRFWHEIPQESFKTDCISHDESRSASEKWYPYNKGGGFRRWFGNNEHVVNWQHDGREVRIFVDEINKIRPGGRLKNQEYYFLESLTYSAISSGLFASRYNGSGFLFDTKGSCLFANKGNLKSVLGYLNSKAAQTYLDILCPTLDYSNLGVNALPYKEVDQSKPAEEMVSMARTDWDAYETSWDFTTLPLLATEHRTETLAKRYAQLRAHWRVMTAKMQRLEEDNNRVFIDAYGLQDELTPEVPLEEITLTCNPAYSYKGRSEDEQEALLLADTMREFVSYGVGCMFGRYSLDKPGLILANQGDGVEDYLAKNPNPTFVPDADNVIPMLDGDWFADDIAARFRKFLRVTFGDEHFQVNLVFIEEALGKDIRRYFTRDFFSDHVQRYKKRPIYWLFSSPKGTFNAVIYMHRYRPDTVSVVLNDYLREFRSKLEAHRRAQEALSISGDASPAQKTKALKEIEVTAKQIEELDAWEHDVLFPLATQKIEIDLDDGVKANYPKFGAALKPIKGLNDASD